MKQTAIEWLIQQVKSKDWQDKFIWHKEDVFKKAEEMEKEEMHAEYMQGWKDGLTKQQKDTESLCKTYN